MYKLLLVDDEQIIREGLEKMIALCGMDIVITASCSNAIAALDSMMDDMQMCIRDSGIPALCRRRFSVQKWTDW